MSNYAAAWVPEQEDRSWDDATRLAAAWVEAWLAKHGGRPVVVAVAKSSVQHGDDPHLDRLVAKGDLATPRSHAGLRPAGPVLAYVPDEAAMALAHRLAHGTALCVVEGFGFRVDGWASEARATDLDTGAPPEPLEPEMQAELDRIKFYGNNGWTNGFGATQSMRHLAAIKPRLPRGFVVSAMAAHGASADGMKRLAKLYDKA